MADAGPDDTTRLVTIFLGANDASLEDQNPAQHVAWRQTVNEKNNGKKPGKITSETMESLGVELSRIFAVRPDSWKRRWREI